MKMPCACFSLIGRPPQPRRIARSRTERGRPTTARGVADGPPKPPSMKRASAVAPRTARRTRQRRSAPRHTVVRAQRGGRRGSHRCSKKCPWRYRRPSAFGRSGSAVCQLDELGRRQCQRRRLSRSPARPSAPIDGGWRDRRARLSSLVIRSRSRQLTPWRRYHRTAPGTIPPSKGRPLKSDTAGPFRSLGPHPAGPPQALQQSPPSLSC